MGGGNLRALAIVREALDSDPETRDAFVGARCGTDAQLHAEVRSLLAGAEQEERTTRNPANGDAGFDDPLVGTLLGPFRVHERLGRGGMGVVHRGEREGGDFAQEVALKVIRRGFDFDDIRRRFLRERRILAQLDHPHLARFIDGGVADDGRPWFALEHVRGLPLDAWCDARRLPVRQRVRLFLDVCAAVQHAHSQLVVHRDLKPGNVLVDEDGRARLLDFGIARLLEGEDGGHTVTVAGQRGALTPEYAAPEQLAGAPATTATDVYALGVMLYELVSGALPHRINRHDLAAAHQLRTTPPSPLPQAAARDGSEALAARMAARSTNLRAWRREVAGDLRRIIDKALAAEPRQRYAAVQGFADDLEHWLRGQPVKVSGSGTGYRVRKFVLRHRLATALAAFALLAIVGGLGATLWQMQQTAAQRDAALAEARRSEAMREYLMLMFREAAGQRDATRVNVREVFRSGAERLFTEFAGRPAAGRAAALMLGELFMLVGDLDATAPLLERLLAGEDIEEDPDVQAQARYNLAQVQMTRGDTAGAAELLALAQQHWARRGDPARLLYNESRGAQARLERAAGNPAQAIATLEAAVAERRRLLPDGDLEMAGLLNGLALAHLQTGHHAEAIGAADGAHAVLVRLGHGESVHALAALGTRCNALVMQGRHAECLDDYARIVELTRSLQGESEKLSAALHNHALVLARMERLDEALPLLTEAQRLAQAHTGADSPLTLSTRIATAELLARMGDASRAMEMVEAALATAQERYAALPSMLAAAHRARAQAHLSAGRRSEGRADLARALELYGSTGPAGAAQIRLMEPLRSALADD